MSSDDNIDIENFSHWVDKLFPINSLVVDLEGNQYFVNGWFILREQIYVKLMQGVGQQMTVYNVLFDEVVQWERFPPGHKLIVSSEPKKKTSILVKTAPLVNSFNRVRNNIEKSTGLIMRQFAKIIKSRHAHLTDGKYTDKYSCVSIRYDSSIECKSIHEYETRPYLSDKPPQSLETKQRFLLSEGISLPLQGCTARHCRCRFIHHKDRRVGDRRDHDGLMAHFSASTKSERRSRSDRRGSTQPMLHN